VIFLLSCGMFAGPLLDEALESFSRGDFSQAQRVLEEILSRPSPPQEDAAMFLLVRVHLARHDGAEAADLAERLLKRFPESCYEDDAHYARAEALFLEKELVACAQELVWVVENAADGRLREKALGVLPRLTEKSRTAQERKRLSEIAVQVPEELPIPSSAVVVLLAFPEGEAPEARALRQSMEFALRHSSPRVSVVFKEVASTYECAQTARQILADEKTQLLVFAGDEGSASSLALLSDRYQIPVLMLTGYAHSFTDLSDYVFEFLPSRFTQSLALAQFAAKDLQIRSFLELVASDDEGRALEEGFRRGVERAGGAVKAVEWYSPRAPSVRAPLRSLFATSKGDSKDEAQLSAALTDSELTALWGGSEGEVLLLNREDSLQVLTQGAKEALFFAIPSGRVADMASQMGSLPPQTILLGNSAWIDEQALEQFTEISKGLIVAAPLIPEIDEPGFLQQLYEDSVERRAGLWELLGMDAATFIATVMTRQPASRQAMKDALRGISPFEGTSVRLDFQEGRENRAVRILRYEEGTFHVLK
jgi:ABC-type branched-subunit amino acid transport system substrate-binding protein